MAITTHPKFELLRYLGFTLNPILKLEQGLPRGVLFYPKFELLRYLGFTLNPILKLEHGLPRGVYTPRENPCYNFNILMMRLMIYVFPFLGRVELPPHPPR